MKRLTDEKGYGKWFDLLYPIVKSRDSCQPEQAREPSANESSAKEIIERERSDCSSVEGGTKEPTEKSMFVPVKRKGKKDRSDQIASAVDLIRSAIENDPTKQLLEGIHEEMKLASEQEKRYLDILLGSGGELCRRGLCSLAGLTRPDWSKGRGQTKNSPWSSRLGVGRRADNPLPENAIYYRNRS